jgi:hypothetical protein
MVDTNNDHQLDWSEIYSLDVATFLERFPFVYIDVADTTSKTKPEDHPEKEIRKEKENHVDKDEKSCDKHLKVSNHEVGRAEL